MADMPLQSLHQQCVVVDALIVDSSNVNVPKPFIPGLHAIARSQLPAAPQKSVVIGTTPLTENPSSRQAVWESLGYSAHFKVRDLGGEKFVDDALVSCIQQAVLDVITGPNPKPSEHLIVLVSGDGNFNGGRPSFRSAVLNALREGFNVKLICFKAKSSVYLEYAASFPNQMQIMIIDKEMVANASRVGNVAAVSVKQPPRFCCQSFRRRCALVAAGGAAVVNVQQPLQQAGAQSFVTKAYDFLHNLKKPATSAATAVLMSQLGAQLVVDLQRENIKLKRCLLDNPSRFCLLNLDQPGRESVYILPLHT